MDYFSSPDGWDIGFEIVYRIESKTVKEPERDECKKAVTKSFGLPRDHYRFDDTFWRVYWDKGPLNLGLLKRCEKLIDQAARASDVLITLHLSAIQPRSRDYIKQQVEFNK